MSPTPENIGRRVDLTLTHPIITYRKTLNKDCYKQLKQRKQQNYGLEQPINDDSYMRRMSSKKSFLSRSKGKLSGSTSTFKHQSSQKLLRKSSKTSSRIKLNKTAHSTEILTKTKRLAPLKTTLSK